MLYNIIRALLFQYEPELSHRIALNSLATLNKLKLITANPHLQSKPSTYMGLNFPNLVGIAAGLDKNGEYIDALAALGCGFIEIGTVTPRPQPGNLPPRIFRLPQDQAIINRLGFNNKGIDVVVENIKKAKFRGILGVNIGKNSDTPIESAIDDYIYCFNQLAPYASYITINVSSPNTQNLRNLQHGELLYNLLHTIKEEQTDFYHETGKYLPLVIKISPDLNMMELKQIAATIVSAKIDGVITCNTTISRKNLHDTKYSSQQGGLSGKPLYYRSTAVTKVLRKLLPQHITIIASGGITSINNAKAKFTAGANLIQIYTGLIYNGPTWLKKLITSL